MKPKSITIKEVAIVAGVSTQTVSRVWNNRPDVATETRKHVKEVIRRLDYQPNALARSLIQNRSFTLGIVTSGLKYIGPSQTLNGMISQAEELGYSLLIKELDNFQISDCSLLLQSLISRQVDGIVWAVPEVGENRHWLESKLQDIDVPLVFLTMGYRSDLSIVSIDNYRGGFIATEHLLEQMYAHIGHISGPLDWWESRERKLGWKDALSKNGDEVTEKNFVEGNWSPASGERAMSQLLEQYPEMDAVFVANDQMAIGAMNLARQRKKRIPQDLAFVGFDGLPETAYFWPPLTTVRQQLDVLGSRAVQEVAMLINAGLQEDGNHECRIQSLQPDLITRSSSVRR